MTVRRSISNAGSFGPAGPGVVELLLAHPIGITEVAVGTVDDAVIELSSTAVSLAPAASPVTELRRRIQGRGDELSFELRMAMKGVELQWHAGSKLTRS
jgi:THAP4-like, heme-binding beta-barrel domain